VVLPVRDRPAGSLGAVLRAFAAQTRAPDELIVVDQASRAAHAASYRALARAHSGVRLLRCPGPPSWNKPMAINRGIRAAREGVTHVLCADADLLFAPHALETLARHQADGPCVVHGWRHDLPADAPLDAGWPALAALARLTDMHARPWLLAPLWWLVAVRGYDERMFGRGCMDSDLVDRAHRDPRVRELRVPRDPPITVHLDHARPAWSRTRQTPETVFNARILATDRSLVRNGTSWGMP
jgi:glycosyltransferase involved in cell wall biosynthesis